MGHRSTVVAIAVVSLVTAWACLPDRVRTEQRRFAKRHMPEGLQARSNPKGEARAIKLRVYAGHDHRAQTLHWREEFEAYLDLANQLLVPELGVRLEVAEYEKWSRQTSNDKIEQALEELEGLDAAADVDLVVGLVSSLSVVSATMRELGRARYMGRHIVLRGFNDLAEHKAFAAHLDRLEGDERKRFFLARKQHKQATVLLHELGHVLGCMHVEPRLETIMSPMYQHEARNFAPPAVALMRIVIAAKLVPAGERSDEGEMRALYDYVVGTDPWPGWLESELAETRGWLQEFSKNPGRAGPPGRPADTPASASASATIPAEAEQIYKRVKFLAQKNQLDPAWSELEGLLGAYPAHPEFRLAACDLWLKKEGATDTAIGHCRRVGELDPGDVRGELFLARTHAQAGEIARVASALQPVLERIPAMPEAAQNQAWEAVMGFYRGINAVTWAEQTAASAPPSAGTEATREWAQRIRRRYGLPPDAARFGISPEREGDYLSSVRTALDLVYSKKYSEAKDIARSSLRRFRNAPGLLGALCDAEVRSRRYGAARPLCTRALAGFPDNAWARYLLGIIELQYRRNQAGIGHLERAIAADPDLQQAYRALYKAYGRVKNKDAQKRLSEAHHQRFGSALP